MSLPLRILCLGDDHPHATSRHRAEAFRRIGCHVEMLNPRYAYVGTRLPSKIHYLTGQRIVAPLVHRWLARQTEGKRFDVVWVDGGSVISKASVLLLKQLATQVLNYAIDDPTGVRDGNNWGTFLHALPYYDLCAVVRVESEQEFRRRGAKKVLRIWRSYDEVAHAPHAEEGEIPEALRSEVGFIGTWMKGEGRDEFLLKLLEAGIAVSLWGDRWHKSPFWDRIKPHWRSGALAEAMQGGLKNENGFRSLGGRDYVGAMQGAKICLGFLSKGNRDLHTQRSSEIPYAGGLFCAERTSEHLQMFEDGVEAVFWSSVEECIQKCRELLADETRRRQIREAGMRRIRALGLGNETVCRRILVELGHDSFQNQATRQMLRLQSVS